MVSAIMASKLDRLDAPTGHRRSKRSPPGAAQSPVGSQQQEQAGARAQLLGQPGNLARPEQVDRPFQGQRPAGAAQLLGPVPRDTKQFV